jgi:hypothetical protein
LPTVHNLVKPADCPRSPAPLNFFSAIFFSPIPNFYYS